MEGRALRCEGRGARCYSKATMFASVLVLFAASLPTPCTEAGSPPPTPTSAAQHTPPPAHIHCSSPSAALHLILSFAEEGHGPPWTWPTCCELGACCGMRDIECGASDDRGSRAGSKAMLCRGCISWDTRVYVAPFIGELQHLARQAPPIGGQWAGDNARAGQACEMGSVGCGRAVGCDVLDTAHRIDR